MTRGCTWRLNFALFALSMTPLAPGVLAQQTTTQAGNPSAQAPPSADNPEAAELLNRALVEVQKNNLTGARELTAHAELLNPTQPRLWAMKGLIAYRSGKPDEYIAILRKEIAVHPDSRDAHASLAVVLLQLNRRSEAIEPWLWLLRYAPELDAVATKVVTLLTQEKRYAEIAPALEDSIKAVPQNFHLRVLRIRGYLGTGQTERALAEAQEISGSTRDPATLNGLAFEFADAGVAMESAAKWARRAVLLTERDCSSINMTNLGQKEVDTTSLLAAEWDTTGWIYFKTGDLAKAETYVGAAWRWTQNPDFADHLAQIYENGGKPALASHTFQLALGATPEEDRKERLLHAHVPVRGPQINGAAELSQLRMLKFYGVPKETPGGEYYAVMVKEEIEDLKRVDGTNDSNKPPTQYSATGLDLPFADDGSEMATRRGLLSCSAYTTPSCLFIMQPPPQPGYPLPMQKGVPSTRVQ